LSVFLIVALAAPWYTIEAYGLPPPLDSVLAIFWWPGMQLSYIPPLNGQRELLVSWDSLSARNPKDVYMSSMAMGILAWIATQVLLVAIMFGQICKGRRFPSHFSRISIKFEFNSYIAHVPHPLLRILQMGGSINQLRGFGSYFIELDNILRF